MSEHNAGHSAAVHCLVVQQVGASDPRSDGLLANAHALGFRTVTKLRCQDLYFIEGNLTDSERDRLANQLLSDPVSERWQWHDSVKDLNTTSGTTVVETALRPGVTDPVAEQIQRCAVVLGLTGVKRASTGKRFLIEGTLGQNEVHALCKSLLSNAVIERYAIGTVTPSFPEPATASGHVEVIPVRGLSDEALLALSQERRAALDLMEMRAIRDHFTRVGRDPTDVEFEAIAQTWSEHCVHKTFKARVTVNQDGREHEVDGILRTFIMEATKRIDAPWVRSAFEDNAGIMEFDDEYDVAFKVETHNHPSAIEPFGGSNTGVGGVIRDVLGVSARPIANTDVLCFGPPDQDIKSLPEGVLHPRRIRAGVVAGVQDYGNKMGIPTVNGAVLYDAGFTANPLVFCGCAGLLPRNKHPRQPQKGDRIIVMGGRTGRDGLRGATFSSMTMDAKTGEVSGASVQIGDPIVEKCVMEVITRARDAGWYNAITDCGAGGLSSAVGEMTSEVGGEVDLAAVPLKYPGLAPWEIWLSEAQERMVLAVPDPAPIKRLCEIYNVEMTDIGVFTGTGRLIVKYGNKTVLELDNQFLHKGIPRRNLRAEIQTRTVKRSSGKLPVTLEACGQALLRVLSHPDVASKEEIIRIYDHEVQGGTVIKPLVGTYCQGPSDGAVLRPAVSKGKRGIVLGNGINPQFGKLDAYRMAVSVVDEAVRNAVAVGADPDRLAILDNFCFGDPLRASTLGDLVEASRGCRDAALAHRAPFISGKDSLNNEYLGSDGLRHAIPPTLLISSIALMENVGRAVTMDLKEDGNLVYLLGETRDEMGGSQLHRVLGLEDEGEVPGLPEGSPALNRALHKAMAAGQVCACHDLSEGGLMVAASEMCLAGMMGMDLCVPTHLPLAVALFSESNGRYLVEVKPDQRQAFESRMAGHPVVQVGTVTAEPRLRISGAAGAALLIPVETLQKSFTHPAAMT